MNDILFRAILSMDSYNRGYGEGITLPVVLNVTQIGNAVIYTQSDVDANHNARSVGFYALAYQNLSSGAVTVSYRGTDDIGLFHGDFINGWVGFGGFLTEQDGLAGIQ